MKYAQSFENFVNIINEMLPVCSVNKINPEYILISPQLEKATLFVQIIQTVSDWNPTSFRSDMVREWPQRQTQTKAAMKKKKPLEEKVLADVRKRVSQIDKLLKPALENSSLARETAREAEHTAHAVAKVRSTDNPTMD